jgi:hypothetical protein
MEKPTGKRPPTAFPMTLEIESTDFHIPSAPTTAAHLTENQNPDRRMIAPPAQMISSSSIPAASQKIRFLMIDNRKRDITGIEARILAKEARLKTLWGGRLGHQMEALPEYDDVFRTLRRELRQAGFPE